VWRAKWALLFPAIILGGIYLGFFTPTESAAVAVIYAVFVSGVVYRELSLRRLVYCLGEAARITAGVMILVASAAIFARVLNMEQAPQAAARLLEQRVAAPWILLLGTNLLLLAMGCVLDAISVFYILVPILLPPLVAAGFDPVHLGVVFTVNLAIGQVTPPVGVSLFVSCELSRTSIGETLRQSWLLLVLAVISLVLLNLFPALVLWLPSTMRAAGQ
jgi:C4-dicarboxylate transporter DctM subunit